MSVSSCISSFGCHQS